MKAINIKAGVADLQAAPIRPRSQPAPLDSRAGLGERDRGGFLREIVQNGSGSDRNSGGGKARDNERPHGLSPVFPGNHPTSGRRFILANGAAPGDPIFRPRGQRPPFQFR